MLKRPVIWAALLSCAHAQTPLTNGDFETSPFATGWTNAGAISSPGFAPGSTQAARFTGSGQSLKQSVSWNADWHLETSFMVRQTSNRQFSLIIGTGSATSALNLRYQDGWQAFSGGWGTAFPLSNVLPSIDQNGDGDCDDAGDTKNVYRLRVTGHDWGTPLASYDLALSDANGAAFTSTVTGLARFQSTPSSSTPTSFKFGTEFGSNPGFWIDNVSTHDSPSDPPPIITSFLANGNILSWQTQNAPTLTLNPGNIDVSGLTEYEVSPTSTTTYILTTGSESRSFTIGVNEATSPLTLSEFLAINPSVDDWIELHNPNNFSLNLTNYVLTDNINNPDKFPFPPTTIQPGEYLVLTSEDFNFSLSGSGEYLALLDSQETILTEFAPQYPAQSSGVSYGLFNNTYVYLGDPTPGEANVPTPYITNHTFVTNPDGSITVSVLTDSPAGSIISATLRYRRMFDSHSTVTMTPNGNLYTATIPANAASPGEMIRWQITVTDTFSQANQLPRHLTTDSPEYFGTVIPNPAFTTQLPVLQWFLPPANFSAADTRTGTRCSLFWQGEFYDNVLVHLRGATTASLEKKPHQFEANPGHDFLLHPDAPRVDQINVNAAYPDSSYLRDILLMENLHNAGIPTPETFPVRVQRNGTYHSLGIMVEQPDNEFLNRHDDLLDPDGPLFKATGNGSWLASTTGFETRNKSDLSDLATFTTALNSPDQLDFLFENTDIPSLVNYLAVNVIDSIFNPQKNYYVHQNRFGEWMILPWDRDFSYGHRWLGGGDPRGPSGPINFLVTDERYEWGGSNNDLKGGYNRLFDAIFDHPETSEIFYRRLRTMMDTILSPGTLESRIEELRTLMKQEADLDRATWGFTRNNPYRNFPQESFDAALDRIKNTYLPQRRTFLENDGGTPSRGTLPSSQPSQPSITFGQIITNPVSGDQDDESLELQNPNNFAIDISNWTLSGAISHTLRPGTVIPANSSLTLSPHVQQFRDNNPPTFSQGNFSGHFSNFSETLNLHDSSGNLIATTITPDTPSNNQLYLVISEIMYHPADDTSEFIELVNTSDTLTLDLSGVSFTEGVQFNFPADSTLAPGQRILISTFASGRLSNGGETLKLEDADGSTISEFTYSDSSPWPTSPDGSGTSLTFISGDPNLPINWRSGGSPGTSDKILFLGGDLLDYAITSHRFDFQTNMLTVQRNLGADDAQVIPQWSSDLITWQDSDFTLLTTEPLTCYDKPEAIQSHTRDYYASIEQMDRSLGTVLDELDRLGVRDNTWIIMQGDNGWLLGEHGLTSKVLAYEDSIRVPLIISPPAGKAQLNQDFALGIDIAPTILNIAGLETPSCGLAHQVRLRSSPIPTRRPTPLGRPHPGSKIHRVSRRALPGILRPQKRP